MSLRGLASAVTWVSVLAACRPLPIRPSTLPEQYRAEYGPLVILSDFPVPRDHRLFKELVTLKETITRRLDLPESGEPILVHLFQSAARSQAFLRAQHPELPRRRAFFLKTDTRLIVYAHWGDRVAEDLRHEVCHGYLHAAALDPPLWLDEGLAEFFEVPRGQQGINLPHLRELSEALQAGQWMPNLRRLESITTMAEMSQQDYAESWAWAHFLLQTDPRRAELLIAYLAEMRQTGLAPPFAPLLSRELVSPEIALIRHIELLAKRHTIAPPA